MVDAVLKDMTRAARQAAFTLACSTDEQRVIALREAARALRIRAEQILTANREDLAALSSEHDAAFRDRLTVTPERIETMAKGVEAVADLPDPLGRVLAAWARPNGLQFRRVAVPLGVIGMIYESRPNVGADAAALCIRSGNAVLLRGGAETFHSARAIHAAMVDGLKAAGFDSHAVQIFPSVDRAFVGAMLRAVGEVDLIVPRGGHGLVERVLRESRVPVLAHAAGLCHTYIHASAQPDMAQQIMLDAKLRRPGICGATETMLMDAAIAPQLLLRIVGDLAAKGCTFRADERARAIMPELPAATPDDFATEWLAPVLSIALMDDVDEALAHIAHYSSGHTEAIIAEDAKAVERFFQGTESAVVLCNASTQFCDGGEFGFGAEIGIATGRLHARGPVGVEQLTTYRYEVRGTGQIRG